MLQLLWKVTVLKANPDDFELRSELKFNQDAQGQCCQKPKPIHSLEEDGPEMMPTHDQVSGFGAGVRDWQPEGVLTESSVGHPLRQASWRAKRAGAANV